MGQKKVTYRAKKRKYGGNQHSHHTPVQEACNDNLPTTHQNMLVVLRYNAQKRKTFILHRYTSHFMLIDYEILPEYCLNIVVGQCPECQSIYTTTHGKFTVKKNGMVK